LLFRRPFRSTVIPSSFREAGTDSTKFKLMFRPGFGVQYSEQTETN